MRIDTELEADVEAELLWDPRVDADGLLVSVRDGIVSLGGHVASYAEKWAAETAAKTISGVRALVNEPEVRPKTLHSDREIAAAALKALKASVIVPVDTIQVVVSDGWITLDGQVLSRHQRDCAEETCAICGGSRESTTRSACILKWMPATSGGRSPPRSNATPR